MTKTDVIDVEVKHDLGVKIEFKGHSYTLNCSNNGDLILTSTYGQLILKPRSSNSVYVESEK
ncbi:hypothetical protein EKK58_08435 [Candidatus Dependentiae bacterium]|nr:MAG: hypothetical protein EKK58_08435 [Candidatus Dependentiae bacterium]